MKINKLLKRLVGRWRFYRSHRWAFKGLLQELFLKKEPVGEEKIGEIKGVRRINKVTLYIPYFNAEKYLKSCLEGVLRQTYPIEEILVIDDGSKRSAVEVIHQFPVKIIKHVFNKGLASSRNTAIKNAKGDFVASLDADCVPQKDWLEKLMINFSSSKIAGVGGRLQEFRISTLTNQWRAAHMKQEWGEGRTSYIPFLFGSNTVFRKDILINLGGYNENYRNNFEDVDISRRIRKNGYMLIYEPEAVVYHIKEDDIFSLLETFWCWYFDFYKEKGSYTDYRSVYHKMKENIRLANRFIREDLSEKRFNLIYIDFLLSILLSLKDFLFVRSKNTSGLSEDDPFYMFYLALLEQTNFSQIDFKNKYLRKFILFQDRFLPSFFVLLFIVGKILRKKVDDPVFLQEMFRYFLKCFVKEEIVSQDFLLEKLLLMIESYIEWCDLLNKPHPDSEGKVLRKFFKDFQTWLNKLCQQIPDIFHLFRLSQNILRENGEG